MKKFLLSFLLTCFGLALFAQSYTVTISGVVEEMNTSNPIEGAVVELFTDSANWGAYYNTVYTDNSGYYEDSFDVPDGDMGMLFVSTPDCNGLVLMQTLFYSDTSAVLNADFEVCTDSTGGCQAMFYYYPEPNNYSIQFMDESYGNPNLWSWSFGDGTSSTEQNPLHTYSDVGEYLVSLTIEGDGGCYSQIEQVVWVTNDSTWPGDCQAMFYYYQEPSTYDVQFMDESLGFPTQWSWNFGDGAASTEQNPSHTYSDIGEYIVSLTIEGDSGCLSTMEQVVWVTNDTTWPGDCQAVFAYVQDTMDMNVVSFFDMSFGTNGGPIDFWYWDFGDGNTSYEQNPVHSYNAFGTYNVCLTITDSLGNCTSVFCMPVVLIETNPDCQAQFYAYPMDSTGSGSMLEMQFVDYSMGEPDEWSWDFGDGTYSNDQHPVHTFSDYGLYQVCLTIGNIADSCSSTWCQDIYVMGDTTNNCITWYEYDYLGGMDYEFEGILIGSSQPDFFWDFGDGTSANGQVVTHTFADNGLYEVTLYASDSMKNCFTQYTELMWVGDDSTYNATISGYVYVGDSMFADVAEVTLMIYDSLTNGVTPVDTMMTANNAYYEFEVDALDQNVYFVLAELPATSAYANDFVPTYHMDAIFWGNAWPIFAFYGGWNYDVIMQPVVFMQNGSGDINGMVNNEESRGLMEDVEILLLNTDKEPLTYLKTNADGQFDFSELAYGDYLVYTEIPGIETIPVPITLSEDAPSAAISIVVKNGQAVLGVTENESVYLETVGDVFPNPVTNSSQIVLDVKEQGSFQISISNYYGQLQSTKTVDMQKGKMRLPLQTESLPQGLYLIQISAPDGLQINRKFLKLR